MEREGRFLFMGCPVAGRMLVVLGSLVAGTAAAEGNLNPSRDELANGLELLNWALRARDMPSLMPKEVNPHLGIVVRLSTPESNEALIRRRWYRVIQVPAHVTTDRASYHVTWDAQANNGAFLRLPINDFGACITEELLKDEVGTDYVRSLSSLRHFWNRPAPRGIRPQRESYTYTLANGIALTFSFDFVCASEIEISHPQAVGWTPDASDLAE